jgi:hypothetical protein
VGRGVHGLLLKIYKTGMITMLSLIEQLNVKCHIAMNVVSTDSSCSVVWWGARPACAEVSTGSVEALKARLGFKSHMALEEYTYRRLLLSIYYTVLLLCLLECTTVNRVSV